MTHPSSWPGLSRPSTSSSRQERKTWMPGTGPDMTRSGLLRQILLQRRPAQLRLPQEPRRSGGERIAVVLAPEQIKPLSGDQPKPGVAGKSDAARQIDRVVAPELGAVNIGMGDKRRA